MGHRCFTERCSGNWRLFLLWIRTELVTYLKFSKVSPTSHRPRCHWVFTFHTSRPQKSNCCSFPSFTVIGFSCKCGHLPHKRRPDSYRCPHLSTFGVHFQTPSPDRDPPVFTKSLLAVNLPLCGRVALWRILTLGKRQYHRDPCQWLPRPYSTFSPVDCIVCPDEGWGKFLDATFHFKQLVDHSSKKPLFPPLEVMLMIAPSETLLKGTI